MAPFCRGKTKFIDKRNFLCTDLFGDQKPKKGGNEFSELFYRQISLKLEIIPFWKVPDVTAGRAPLFVKKMPRCTSYID